MKLKTHLTLIMLSILLLSCSGSDTYQGQWKAIDNEGNKIEINFEPKTMTFNTDKEYKYTQNQVNIKNGVTTYGINLSDGRSYSIRFPLKNDDSKAVILDENENIMYVMGRLDYITQEELYRLD